MLSRRKLIHTAGAVLNPLRVIADQRTVTPGRPNLILIVADYMGYGDTEPYGATDVRTPNLRRLAGEGVRLTNAYASAPICAPSRAALLTGRYQQRFGVERNPVKLDDPGIPGSERTLAELLKEAGYYTFMVGKWHLGFGCTYGPNAKGFASSLAFYDWSIDYFSHRTPQGAPGLFEDGRPVEMPGYSTDLFTERTVSLIRRNSGRPFFGYVAYNATLPPHQSPKRPSDVRAKSSRPVSSRVWHRATRQDYIESIESMDEGIGRILSALDDVGALSNTIVVFTCDHGGSEDIVHHGPLSEGFGRLGEGGIRVPLIISWPGMLPAAATCAQESILMDVVATVMRASSVQPPRPLDGIDLAPILRRLQPPTERVLCWRAPYDTSTKAIRKGHWKLRHNTRGDRLFDLAVDVSEQRNVAMKNPQIVKELSRLLAMWESSLVTQG